LGRPKALSLDFDENQLSDPVATPILGKYQFRMPNFTALEEVLGQEIQLLHHGFPTIIRVPVKEDLPALETKFPLPAPTITAKSGPTQPQVFAPRAVFVAVDLGTHLIAPDQAPAGPQKQEIVARASLGRDAALAAFRYWVSIVRWRTMCAWFGRDLPVMAVPNAEAYTHDGRFVLSSYPAMKFRLPLAITASIWQDVAAAIARRDVPPVAHELYFDAVDRLECGDHRRAVLEAAMAAEVAMRRFLAARAHDSKATNRVERARVPELLEMLHHALSEPSRTDFADIKNDLKLLSQWRNTLVHTGIFTLSEENCEKSCEVARKVLLLT
jgi:hypothetical protein